MLENQKSERFFTGGELDRLVDRQIQRLSFSTDCPRITEKRGVMPAFKSKLTKMTVEEILGKKSGALDAPLASKLVSPAGQSPGILTQKKAQIEMNNKIIHTFSSRENCTKLVYMLRELSTLSITLSPQEEAVISLPENVLLIGRSGTGKTTCGMLMLFVFVGFFLCSIHIAFPPSIAVSS
mmetsp:Transcript_15423/g.39364  ORF Transcript_15423/g.39364 Transcript_15423/m.39364 type:complete len:181 (-) Transcript_15423:6672-7214(-)